MPGIEGDDQPNTWQAHFEALAQQFRDDGWPDDENLGVTLSMISDEAEQVASRLRDGSIAPWIADPDALHEHLIGLEPDSYVLELFGPHVADLALKYLRVGQPEQQ